MRIRALGLLRFEDRWTGMRLAPENCRLAVYLAMHPKRFSRNALAGLLWGDKNDGRRHS